MARWEELTATQRRWVLNGIRAAARRSHEYAQQLHDVNMVASAHDQLAIAFEAAAEFLERAAPSWIGGAYLSTTKTELAPPPKRKKRKPTKRTPSP